VTAQSTGQLDPIVVAMGEGQKDIAANMLFRRVASAEQTGGEFSLVEISGVRGTGAYPHRHGNEAEAFYITEGAMRVHVADMEHLAVPGDFIYIPKNARHKFFVESERGSLLCLTTPGGFEGFYTEMGRPADGPYPPNPPFPPLQTPANMAEIVERYNWHREEDW
jgi:quercetin dioxygenase-like cupin family protein